MTHLLLRADRHTNDIRIFAEPRALHHPVARWERGDDGVLRCVWRAC